MRTATTCLGLCLAAALLASTASAQDTDFLLDLPPTAEFTDPYPPGIQSGSRAVAGPFDMDGDGLAEVIFADYTGGGRAHVVENVSAGVWELVYSTPALDSTATTAYNARYVYATNASADLDGDGKGEILIPAGAGYSDTTAVLGLYVFEYTGTDNDYGSEPASVLALDGAARIETHIIAEDLDGDGTLELLFPNNAANAFDYWYVYSVNGDIGGGFETWVQEMAINPRTTDHGGGSPNGVYKADFNGDGTPEYILHSWNNYNFTIGHVTGPDTYDFPEGVWTKLDASDGTTYAGGTTVDINSDGDDELFLSYYCCSAGPAHQNKLAVVNFEESEPVDSIGPDNFVLGLFEESFPWGIASGDLDQDGQNEVFGVGIGYTGAQRTAGEPAAFIRIAEFTGDVGADPEDPANYEVTDVVSDAVEADTAVFNTVYRDSAGVASTYYEHSPVAGALFSYRVAYLGDSDGDGRNELALSFQSVPDSVDAIDEVWNADSLRYDRTVRSRTAVAIRPFGRIVSFDRWNTAVEGTIITPDQYVLEANYPNPFNDETTIGFELPLDKRISVKVYDITGRLVRTLVNDEQYLKGSHTVTWDGRSANGAAVASGTYLYTLEYGNFRKSRQMVVIK